MTAVAKDSEGKSLETEMRRIGAAARDAARALAIASAESKTKALLAAAASIRAHA